MIDIKMQFYAIIQQCNADNMKCQPSARKQVIYIHDLK